MKVLLLVFLISFPFSAVASNCNLSDSEKSKLLEMDYQSFDQSQGTGWRRYADTGCYSLAATLLDEYLERHNQTLKTWQSRIVHWHSGQMYAFDNDYHSSEIKFMASINPNEPKDSPILWNDYVYASVAFLKKDMKSLQKHRDIIAKGPTFNDEKQNLHVVDALIKCFYKPYREAYSSCN